VTVGTSLSPPPITRTWYIPDDCQKARGCTFLWPGGGDTYDTELNAITSHHFCMTVFNQHTLDRVLNRSLGIYRRYIEIFTGAIVYITSGTRFELDAKAHLYLKPDMCPEFKPVAHRDIIGLVIHY
jgi:hypothetical protein